MIKKANRNNINSLLPTPYYQLPLCVLCVLCVSFFSCFSIAENAGKLLDGSNEKILEHYKSEKNNIDIYKTVNRNNEESILIALQKYPMIKIRANLPDEEGVFYLTALEYLAGSSYGWNEFSLALLGEGAHKKWNSFSIADNIEQVQITSGRVQNRDSRVTGEDAANALRNRHERIKALAEWMSYFTGSGEDADISIKVFPNIKEFEKFWKPVIFPELVSTKKRPKNWKTDQDAFVTAEEIRWNSGYTARLFPEDLRPIRDSGTMLRDWEEALSWIYYEYEWKNIIGILNDEIQLIKIK